MTAQPKGRTATTKITGGRAKTPTPKPEPTTFAEAFKRLNPRRRKFVKAYLERPNGTRAAKAAGYKDKNARSYGSEILTFPDVRAALRLGWAEAGMTAEEVRARTEEVVKASLEDFYSFDVQQVRPKVLRPVQELLTELFAEIDFEERYAKRAKLEGDDLQAHQLAQASRRREALRMEMELEVNPAAARWVPGPPVTREVERLDLAKARDLGVLHLLKTVKYTRNGPAIELEDKSQARQLIGRLHGLWAKDDDKPEGAGLPLSTGLEEATDAEVQAEVARLLAEGVA